MLQHGKVFCLHLHTEQHKFLSSLTSRETKDKITYSNIPHMQQLKNYVDTCDTYLHGLTPVFKCETGGVQEY
jgi:hypothetical protein